MTLDPDADIGAEFARRRLAHARRHGLPVPRSLRSVVTTATLPPQERAELARRLGCSIRWLLAKGLTAGSIREMADAKEKADAAQ